MVETHVPALSEDQESHIRSLLEYPTSTPHLNPFNLKIRSPPGGGAGRGVYATNPVPADTLIEVSPVLLFPPAEYAQYGSKTQLDGYTFVWKRTSQGSAIMALALGLGSLFNHHPTSPNVKYTLDHATHSIRYTTTRAIQAGEELAISYGSGRMWWEPARTTEEQQREEEERKRAQDPDHEVMQMGRIGLDSDEEDDDGAATKAAGGTVSNGVELNAAAGPSRAVVDRSKFPPVYRLTAAIDPVTLPLQTRDAWIIDIPPISASPAVKFLQKHPSVLQNRDDGLHSTRHLRSFRTTPTVHPDGTKITHTQFLLCLESAFPDRSRLVEWLIKEAGGIFGDQPEPYLGKVPVIAAPSKDRLPEWQAVWPCIVRTNPKEHVSGGVGSGPSAGPVLLVNRAKDKSMWTDAKRLQWVANRFKRVVALARHALQQANLEGMERKEQWKRVVASAAHVTHPYDVARRFVPSSTHTHGGVMAWEERETTDWSHLIGDQAPYVGRIHPSPPQEAETHLITEKQRILTTFSMSEPEWANYSTTTSSIYTSPSDPTMGIIEIDAVDQRLARQNPIKHAAIEAVSRVSVLRALDRQYPRSSSPPSDPGTSTAGVPAANGSDYLLTSLSLFTLYEPCIYCTMALLHSRVSEIYFLLPSPGRGACCGAELPPETSCGDAGADGGIYALQEQKGLNHNFTVWRWIKSNLSSRNDAEGEKVDDLAQEFDIGLLDP
ncbi:hypothetical protein NDA13_003210 [Ustilago tritici]|nr:hypothetical protein NDA13_003210 [Ustilago tritici]